METLWQDLRYALRTLRRAPLFTAIAVVTLALGIGVNTTIFSVVNAILIRPMPQVRMQGLVALRELNLRSNEEVSASAANVDDWTRESRSFEAVGTYHDRRLTLTLPGSEPEEVEAEVLTPNLFTLLGVRPALGRAFQPEEGIEGRNTVVLLTHHFWTERMGADPSVVGRTVLLNNAPHTVIGVMPEGFGFPDNQPIWVPRVEGSSGEGRGERYMRVVARLKPGISVDAAQQELSAISSRLAARYPEANAEMGVRVMDFREALPGAIRSILLVMLGAVAFVLLIACANVANLFLARATGRAREFAVRIALGAHRGRLVRQMLTESALVALLGGALGVGLAHLGLQAVLASFPFQPPLWMVFDVDRNVLLFTLAASLATAVLFGLLPALRATRGEFTAVLKAGGRGASAGASHTRLRGALAVGEVALAAVLLVGALLMVRSLLHLQRADAGFRTGGILTERIITSGERYAQTETRDAFFQQLIEQTRALPAAQAVAVTSMVPLSGGSATSGFSIEGRDDAPGESPSAEYRGISGDYFRVLELPLLRGRSFTESEVQDAAPVVVINRTMADRFWPGADPVGERIQMGGEPLTVVGVVPDVRVSRLNEAPRPQVYAPYTARPTAGLTLMVRTAGEPAALAPSVHRIVRELDPGVPVSDVHSMDEVKQISLWQQRLFGGLFTSFALIALLLAISGVYGVISYGVSQRTHEIGVRMALGAGVGRVLSLVLRQGAGMAAVGVGVGLAAALGVARLLTSQLYGVTATDPLTFGLAAALLVGTALLASYLPARRAARVDPMVALRAE